MGIFLRHSYNVKPPRWGSPADVQYAIKINAEKIYQVDPDSIVLAMPLFWGLPLLDYSGHNIRGTNHGAIYKDGSLLFDGVDDYIDFGNVCNVGTSDFTLDARIKIGAYDTGDAWVGIAGKGVGNEGYFLHLGGTTSQGRLRWYTYDGTGRSILSNSVLSLDTWYHILGKVDRSSATGQQMYVDGVLQTETSTGIIGNLNNIYEFFTIGADDLSFRREFDGKIDEVRLSNVVRTAEQIALFHALPYGLYQPVSRPIYFFQAAAGGLSIPVAMSHYLRQMGA